MLDTLSRNITYGRTYCAIEHTGTVDNARIWLMHARLRKGEIVPKETVQLDSQEDIQTHIKGQQHAHLIVNNYQVLFKAVSLSGASGDETLVNLAFPNITLESFYYEIIRQDTQVFVFICRKAYINELIARYEQLKVCITSWSLGVTVTLPLLPFLQQEPPVYSSGYTLTHKVGVLEHLEQSIPSVILPTYTIEDIHIKANHLNALGGIMASVEQESTAILTNATPDQQQHRSLYKQHRFFNLGLPVAIGLLLLIFLVSFLFYNHYYQGVEKLNSIAEANSIQKQRLLKKDSLVSQKQKLFEDVIESASSSSSYFIDQMISVLPESILLDKLSYNPLLRKIREKKPVLFQTGTILVGGNTKNNAAISQWIGELEQLDFVENVSIHNLENPSATTAFELEVKLKTP